MYSSGMYETADLGRAPTVGDTAEEEGKDETACGGETEEADTSVPATTEVSRSLRSWSNETSDSVATVKKAVMLVLAAGPAAKGTARRT